LYISVHLRRSDILALPNESVPVIYACQEYFDILYPLFLLHDPLKATIFIITQNIH
jgi:hypothetical protein